MNRAQAVAEGSLLGLYTFRRHFSGDEDVEKDMKELLVVEMDASKVADAQQGLDRGRVFAEAAMLARDMVNEPSNFMTPTHIADIAAAVAQEHGLESTILERPQMEELGMGGLLGVARGSAEPPKFIVCNTRVTRTTRTTTWGCWARASPLTPEAYP